MLANQHQDDHKYFYATEEISMIVIDIGVFAHNEAKRIAPMLRSLLDQEIFVAPDFAVRLHILANGCTDTTVPEAQKIISKQETRGDTQIHDLPEGGKSRTWNRFVHDLSRPEADILAFLDADILIPNAEVLNELCSFLLASPDLAGASSRPVKDIEHDPSLQKGFIDKLITSASGTLNNWQTAICGQLYLLRSDVARSFYMPIGLPVEDGFARAMVLTENFVQERKPQRRLDGRGDLFHVYTSDRSIGALIQHQTRLVIGSAINAIIYERLSSLSQEQTLLELERSAKDPGWVPDLLNKALPRSPSAYVPTRFLFKRVQFWVRSPNKFHPKRMLTLVAGFAFDLVVYVNAQAKMWRGAGAGYW